MEWRNFEPQSNWKFRDSRMEKCRQVFRLFKILSPFIKLFLRKQDADRILYIEWAPNSYKVPLKLTCSK